MIYSLFFCPDKIDFARYKIEIVLEKCILSMIKNLSLAEKSFHKQMWTYQPQTKLFVWEKTYFVQRYFNFALNNINFVHTAGWGSTFILNCLFLFPWSKHWIHKNVLEPISGMSGVQSKISAVWRKLGTTLYVCMYVFKAFFSINLFLKQ